MQFDVIAKATGTPLTIKIAEIYTIVEGKIAELRVHYWDTHAMREATNGATVLQGEPA